MKTRLLPDEDALECVAFLLIRDGQLLAERRSPAKKVAPGVLAIPGGHCEPGESAEDALQRELLEELSVTPGPIRYICTLLHRSAELRRLHYYAVLGWQGDLVVGEAESLHWVALEQPEALDLAVDRMAVAVFRQVYEPTS